MKNQYSQQPVANTSQILSNATTNLAEWQKANRSVTPDLPATKNLYTRYFDE